MGYRDLVYRLYERRLESSLSGKTMPRHVGVMTDGNRRWARSAGHTDVSKGHRKGADKIFELLQWCKQAGVEVVTLWLLSTDNLSRPQEELGPLLTIIEDTVNGLVEEGWHLNAVGALDLLPDHTARVLKDAGEATADNPGPAGQRRGRLRRAARDRRRGPVAARRAREQGHHDRAARRGPGRRAHRRAPLHGRASPTPTW